MKPNKDLLYGILAVFVLVVLVFSSKFLSFPQDFSEGNNENIEAVPKSLEVIDDIIIIRNLDKELIQKKIEEGKEYLLRMIDKKENGAHKYYYALTDSFENRLHTIYTSSLIYTLLELYNLEKDNSLLNQIFKSSEFVLSMQNEETGTKGYGAFYYSYCLDAKEKEKKFVVGTTSKTIFTLLKLYELTSDSKYLESAKLGADWLVTMQKPDGSMKPYLRYDAEDEKWLYGTKESLPYNGQVLSALSKIYIVTGEKKYYDTAEEIAQRFAKKYEEAGRNYIVGEYRSKNPISNSWVVMSFIDFYKASKDDYYKEVVFELSNLILENQIKNKNDLLNYGRWKGTSYTSGNGWLVEVMTEVYQLCREKNIDGYEKYKDAIIKAIRWLIQNTYSQESSPLLGVKNPERANGGLIRNYNFGYMEIRTDSVCHALNGYIGIINYLGDGLLLSIPEKPLEEVLDDFKEEEAP